MKVSSVKKTGFIGALASFSMVLLLGIAFLILSVKLVQLKVPENYVETEAEITRIEKILLDESEDPDSADTNYEYHVYVRYTYDGETYTDCEYGNYSSSMKEGDKVLLYVDPAAPAEFMSDPSGSIVFLFISIAVVLIGIGGIGYTIYKKKRNL